MPSIVLYKGRNTLFPKGRTAYHTAGASPVKVKPLRGSLRSALTAHRRVERKDAVLREKS
ncbi:hypothetical protein ACFLYL_00545 [Chloroflexota bacterium]